mgnify:FL=1
MDKQGDIQAMPLELSAEQARLYMCCDKVLPSAQGMSIYGDWAFMLYHTGRCAVYDLKTKSSKPAADFWLASANQGTPTKDYINHSNQCMFSGTFAEGNDLPLLYVTTGNGIGGDENGFFYRCAVENIHLVRDGTGAVVAGRSELVQTYSYVPGEEETYGWKAPCWGCPAWFVDSAEGVLYVFSSKYRTTQEYAHLMEQNEYIITKFPLRPEQSGLVRLGAKDILDQFTAPFDILFTQGGMFKDGKIFYTFGFGNETYPDGLRIYDLKQRRLAARMDLSRSILKDEEIECCSFYKGELLCNTNAQPSKLYSLGSVL